MQVGEASERPRGHCYDESQRMSVPPELPAVAHLNHLCRLGYTCPTRDSLAPVNDFESRWSSSRCIGSRPCCWCQDGSIYTCHVPPSFMLQQGMHMHVLQQGMHMHALRDDGNRHVQSHDAGPLHTLESWSRHLFSSQTSSSCLERSEWKAMKDSPIWVEGNGFTNVANHVSGDLSAL